MESVNPNITVPYVPECDRELPPEKQTVFELCRLSHEENVFIKNHLTELGTVQMAALAFGLVKVRNLVHNGTEVKFERDTHRAPLVGRKRVWKDECLSYIPKEVIDEVAGMILSGKALKEAEAKNS